MERNRFGGAKWGRERENVIIQRRYKERKKDREENSSSG
jgi:hypothetical protein